MKLSVFDKLGNKKSELKAPELFNVVPRLDILMKAFEAQKGRFISPYGSKKGAGAQYSASGILKHRRHVWKSTYGKGISRIPRKILSRSGDRFNWVGATVANTRGGRRAHPPKPEKNPYKKINKKELKIAFLSAIAGTLNPEWVYKKYGKEINTGIILDGNVSGLKAKDFLNLIKKIFGDSAEHVLKKKSIRPGIGKMRGRKYKSSAGALMIIGKNEEIRFSRIDIKKASEVEIKDLAPNGEPGRVTMYTTEGIKDLEKRFS